MYFEEFFFQILKQFQRKTLEFFYNSLFIFLLYSIDKLYYFTRDNKLIMLLIKNSPARLPEFKETPKYTK